MFSQRLSVFRWIAAIASHLGSENISSYLSEMLKPVHRELDHGSNSVGKFSSSVNSLASCTNIRRFSFKPFVFPVRLLQTKNCEGWR